jgi:signal transduction histidine kinase
VGRNNSESEALLGASVANWRWRAVRGPGRGVASAGGGQVVYRPNALPVPRLAAARATVACSRGLLTGTLARLAAVLVTAGLAVTVHMDTVRAPSVHAALETAMTLFALAAAWLLRAPFTSSRRARDLLLMSAALALGLTNLWADALPATLGLAGGTYFSSAEIWAQLAVAVILLLAALMPADRLLIRSAHPVTITTLAGLGSLLVVGLGGLLPVAPGDTVPASSLSQALEHPLSLGLVLAGTGAVIYAGGLFARRRREEADRAVVLLVGATVLLGGAGLSHLMTRSLAPERIGADEGLRVLAFSLILAAAVILERRVRRRLARSAALAERRRVARDLHDGLAQDLAFIAAHGPRIAQDVGDEHPVVVAARRALAISRDTISELSDPEGATAHELLEAVAQELHERFRVAIAVDAQPGAEVACEMREDVSRIAREAIVNAARHGHARNVVVSLRNVDRGVNLRVVDNGSGIPPVDGMSVSEGFGLRSMHERAAALGGYVNIRPARGGGTEVEVILP